MPPEIQDDQALALKKRARRRLVGAIALVLIMLAILPMIIKDRAVPEAPKEEIVISMPSAETAVSGTEAMTPNAATTSTTESAALVVEAPIEAPINALPDSAEAPLEAVVVKADPEKLAEVSPPLEEKPVEVKQEVIKPAETKPAEVKPAETKAIDSKAVSNNDFTIQIGVFSDPANVAQMQAKLKASGFSSRTEKINTPKGEKIRLRVGKYASRQEAADALSKLNSTGMTGMVITNK